MNKTQQDFVSWGLPTGDISPYSEEGKQLIQQGFPKGTTCLTCPFRGPLIGANSLADVSNDFSEASYWCHLMETSVWAEDLKCQGSWD